MIGAGVFAAFGPAAATLMGAGWSSTEAWALFLALALAASVAVANATSSAQLAVQYPVAGGTYVFGRERLGAWPGFLAGWGFLIGKTASIAAMSMTFAAYAVPSGAPGWTRRVVAAVLIAGATALNSMGITRTARVAKWIVAAVLCALVTTVVVIAVASHGHAATVDVLPLYVGTDSSRWYGVLQAAGLLFFAFAGYARIATLAEEIRNPRRSIPRAVTVALSIVVVLYAAIAVVLVSTLALQGLAQSGSPLADAALSAGTFAPALAVVVHSAGVLASGGALLALVTGVGRTALAMAREGDLPRTLARVHPTFRVPHIALMTIGGAAALIAATVDLRGAIGFSGVGVLTYYVVTNLAEFTQGRSDRLYPKWMQVGGAILCAALIATLPWQSLVGAGVVFGVGIVYRVIRLKAIARGAGQ
jgi:APA family basic amino acid/polyamine antiporter